MEDTAADILAAYHRSQELTRRYNKGRTCRAEMPIYDEFLGICTLPVNHGGAHDYADTQGMCLHNDDCRASRGGIWPHNGHEHNHRPCSECS